jgi:hypothetical protein
MGSDFVQGGIAALQRETGFRGGIACHDRRRGRVFRQSGADRVV